MKAKITKSKAIDFFSKYFNISKEEARDCNHMTIDCMVKFAKSFQTKEVQK